MTADPVSPDRLLPPWWTSVFGNTADDVLNHYRKILSTPRQAARAVLDKGALVAADQGNRFMAELYRQAARKLDAVVVPQPPMVLQPMPLPARYEAFFVVRGQGEDARLHPSVLFHKLSAPLYRSYQRHSRYHFGQPSPPTPEGRKAVLWCVTHAPSTHADYAEALVAAHLKARDLFDRLAPAEDWHPQTLAAHPKLPPSLRKAVSRIHKRLEQALARTAQRRRQPAA